MNKKDIEKKKKETTKNSKKVKEPKKNTKTDEQKMSELINKVKKVPFDSEPFWKIHKDLSKLVKKKYPGQYILATPSLYGGIKSKIGLSSRLLRKVGFTPWHHVEDETVSPIHSFMDTPFFFFVPREMAEYNLEWKQVNVFGFITDGEKVILLEKTSNKDITMIGGHVDFEPEVYNRSQYEHLRAGMQKELDEEIDHKKALRVPETPIGVINTRNKFHDLYHMAVLYKIKTKNIDKLFEQLKTGEPHKHNIVMLTRDELKKKNNKHHQWLKYVEANM
jgi:predicted NUDIX family phosphoesterase